jgi:SOS-response transcriptional repressor LexA
MVSKINVFGYTQLKIRSHHMTVETSIRKRPGREPVITQQRKQLILNFIHEYRRKREVSPTYLEIAKGIGYADNAEGTAHSLVEALVQEGWLRRTHIGARSLIPVYPPEEQYAEITDPALKDIKQRQRDLRILRRL